MLFLNKKFSNYDFELLDIHVFRTMIKIGNRNKHNNISQNKNQRKLKIKTI